MSICKQYFDIWDVASGATDIWDVASGATVEMSTWFI